MNWEPELSALADSACKLLQVREPEKLKEDFKREIRELKERGFRISERNNWTAEFQSEDERIGNIKKKIIHGPKLERIYGADLCIEFPGKRVILIQCKLKSSKNRFTVPRNQLLAMLKLCQMLCGFFHCQYTFYRLFFSCPVPEGFCPGSTFYELDDGLSSVYLRSCDLSFILGNRKSISSREIYGVSEEEFRESLLKGKIGCRDLPQKEKERIFEFYSAHTNKIIYLLQVTE